MIVYGIDAGQTKKKSRLVKLELVLSNRGVVTSRKLAEISGVDVSTGKKPLSNDKHVQQQEAGKRALKIVQALESGTYFPLAVDAALTCAKTGQTKRSWESYIRGAFPTPEFGCLSASNSWQWICLVWTQVAAELVNNKKYSLWKGNPIPNPNEKRWIAEVYPRASWTSAAAVSRVPLTKPYVVKDVAFRDDLITALKAIWVPVPGAGCDVRDAAIAALNMERVMMNGATYLGEDHVSQAPVISGGGIATFM